MVYCIDKAPRFAVIGHGSWATALVKIILENNQNVGWYVRNPTVIENLLENQRNPRYLSDVELDISRLQISNDINETVRNADVLLVVVPSAFLKSTLEPLTESLDDKFIISAIKGIVPDEYVTVAEYFNQKYELPFDQIGIVTGPCHAEEIALERLSYLTMVCKDLENARILGERFKTRYVNISPSTDIYGAEYAAVIKNIYALAVGISLGLGYGDNFISVLISNGAMEMARFMNETYPYDRDTNASAYLGDLLVTSYSQFSRNRTFGQMIGKGYSVKSAQIEMSMIAEGYYAAACIKHVNQKYNIPMPIAETVYSILYEGKPAALALKCLSKKLI